MLLRGLRFWSRGREGRGDLRLLRGRIVERGPGLEPAAGEPTVELDGYLALPGLINAHDHLQLNLLSRLGTPPYRSFYDWAEEIYRPREPPVCALLRLSMSDRLEWGAYKNLVAGVTTVVHHDPYPRSLRIRRLLRRPFPVQVPSRYAWGHSLGYGGDLVRRHRRRRGRPFIVHAAEGVDERAAGEIGDLDRLGLLTAGTVLVHAVAVSDAEIELLAERGVAVVWCPGSNLYLFERTAPVARMNGRVPLAIGTDSTMSGSPTLLEELRVAASTGEAGPADLLAMVSDGAAAIFGLDAGHLEPGAAADLLLLRDDSRSPAEILVTTRPRDLELVLVAGRAHLAAPELAGRLGLGRPNASVEGEPRWLIGDLARLRLRIRQGLGEGVESQPLWRLLGERPAG